MNIELTRDQAIVLFEWLSRIDDSNVSLQFEHPSEQRVLWDIQGKLEKILSEPFSPNYKRILDQARGRVGGVSGD